MTTEVPRVKPSTLRKRLWRESDIALRWNGEWHRSLRSERAVKEYLSLPGELECLAIRDGKVERWDPRQPTLV